MMPILRTPALRRPTRDHAFTSRAAETLEARTLLAGLVVDVTNLSAAVQAISPGVASAVAGDGVDDSPALQAALDYIESERAAGNTADATILIPEGTFDLATVVRIDASNIRLEGAGRDLTTLQAIAGRGQGVVEGQVGSDTNAETIDPDQYLFEVNSLGPMRSDDVSFSGLTLTSGQQVGGTLHGAIFGRDSDGLTIRESRIDSFAWSGVRLFYVDGVTITGNLFVDAGGRKNVATGPSGGGVFISYMTDSVVANNRFEQSTAYAEANLSFFGIKGRQFRETRLLNNTIATGFSIELPFENDRNVEIAHNYMVGAISIPKYAGGPVYTDGSYAFHIHHNYSRRAYGIELPHNNTIVDSNVFAARPGDNPNSVLFKSFVRDVETPGPAEFTNNLIINPRRQLFNGEAAMNNLTFAGNEIIVSPEQVAAGQATLAEATGEANDDRNLFGFFGGWTNSEGVLVSPPTDYETITLKDNVVDVLSDPQNPFTRPLLSGAAADGVNFENNAFNGVTGVDPADNPDTGAARGIDSDLSFGVGVYRSMTIDANQLAADVRASGGVVPADVLQVPPRPVLPPLTLYPPNSGVIDIAAEYGAIPDDGVDDTEAIQRALADHVGRNRTLVLRDGVYNISDTLEWVAENKAPGGANNNTTLTGETPSGAILKLDDNAASFGDVDNHKIVLDTYFGNSGDSFGNYIENLTIDVGSGNAGAIAVEFQTNNYGSVRDVTLKSSDPDHAGATGLKMSLNFPGPALIENVTIDGFDNAFTAAPQEFSITLKDITLRNQREAGILVWRTPLQIEGLDAELAVPAIRSLTNPGRWGHVVVTDSNLVGLDDTVAAIENQDGAGFVVARDITTTGYAVAVDDLQAGEQVADGPVDFYTSELFELSDTVTRGIDLPLEQYDYDAVSRRDFSQLANVADFAGTGSAGDPGGVPSDLFDDTEAIQAAMDAGQPVVFIPAGTWVVRDTITVPPHVRRIVGADARLTTEGGLFGEDKPMFRIVGESAHGVSFEKIEVGSFGDPVGPVFEHASTRTVAIRDVLGDGTRFYRNTVSGGRVFFDNITGGQIEMVGQQAWSRQMNLEPPGRKVLNVGGDLWILGLKTEKAGTLVETRGGGRTEVLGGLAYPSQPNGLDVPMFINHESSVAFSMPESSYLGGAYYERFVEETRDGVLRSVDRAALTGHSNLGKKLGWYSGVRTDTPAAPTVSNLAATSTESRVTLSWDIAAAARRTLIYRDGVLVGGVEGSVTAFTDDASGTGLPDATAFTYRVVAEGPTGLAATPAELMASTQIDAVPPRLLEARTLDLATVQLTLSEPIDASAAVFTLVTDDAAATPVAINEVETDGITVTLATDPLSDGAAYRLQVDGLTDRATMANPLPTQQTRLVAAVETDTTTELVIRTGDGDGADTSLVQHKSGDDFGADGSSAVSFSPSGPFSRSTLLRFDVSGVDFQSQAISGAELAATLRGGTSGSGVRVFNVYGVDDSLGLDGWTETGPGFVNWDSFSPVGLPNHGRPGQTSFLGTITVDNTGFAANGKLDRLAMSTDALVDFLNADTDGRVSILLKRTESSNEGTNLYTKEGDATRAPALKLRLTPRVVAAPTVSLAAESDTGISDADGLTRLDNSDPAQSLRVVVDGVADGDRVTVYSDQTAIGTAVARGGSVVVLTDGVADLTDGSHTLTAVRQSAAGFVSAASAGQTVVVDTLGPVVTIGQLPGGVTLDALDLFLSESVYDLDADDFVLRRDGQAVATDATLTTTGPEAARLGNLASATTQAGQYDLIATGDATDAAGNPLAVTAAAVTLAPVSRGISRRGEATIVSHTAAMELDGGEVAFSFVTDSLGGTLFSKDHRGYGDGGHLTILIRGGRIESRLQSDSRSYSLRSDRIEIGRRYDVAVRFGAGGYQLLVDGVVVDSNSYTGGLVGNAEDFAIGASKAYGRAGSNSYLRRRFNGRIDNVHIRDAAGQAVFSEAVVADDPAGVMQFNGRDRFVETGDDLSTLSDGAISLTFNADTVAGRQTLLSADAGGYGTGGHLTVELRRGRVYARLQSGSRSYVLRSGRIAAGVETDLRIEFGSGGFRLLLDDRVVDTDAYTGGLVGNTNPLILGASSAYARSGGSRLDHFFAGTIRGLTIEAG